MTENGVHGQFAVGVLGVVKQYVALARQREGRLVILPESCGTGTEARRAVVGEIGDRLVPVRDAVAEGATTFVRDLKA